MNRILITLALAGALALPVLAQQGQSTTSSQPQAQSQSAPATSDQAKPETATGKEPLQYERKEGFWGRLNPFARKKYVQRQLDPVRGRVNELDELTAQNAKM